MKLCNNCKSDMLERTSSIGARIFVCIMILLFIPFGIFLFWIPFVIPHRYECKKCGTESKENDLLEVDWREKEKILEEEKKLEEQELNDK